MPKQTQIRGAVDATQQARTFVSRELDYNTSYKRLHVHDGLTPGGVPMPSYIDTINDHYNYSDGTGTNSVTISLNRGPETYQKGQRFVFKAENTNTGSATLNVDSLGAKTIKKKDVFNGTLSSLEAGDLIQGGVYSVFYNGTDMILESVDAGGIESVSQGDLNTSFGGVSSTVTPNGSVTGGTSRIILPGGEYGFSIHTRINTSLPTGAKTAGWWYGTDTVSTGYVSTVTPYVDEGSGSAYTLNGAQRYITSSPPFDMGDGEVGGFIFALVNSSGEIVSHYAADAPPWGYNGPTDIRGKVCPVRKKKFQIVVKPQTQEEVLDGAPLEYIEQEVTQAIKNADMGLIPHPFGTIPAGHTLVLLDPMDERIRRIINYQNSFGEFDLIAAVEKGLISIDNEPLKRKGPKGVMQAGLRYRSTSKI